MKKNILIFITPKKSATNIPKYYKESFDNLIKNYNTKIYICYEKENIDFNEEKKHLLEKDGYFFKEYLNEEDLITFSKNFNLEENNIEVYTYREVYINLMEKIKKSLNQEITEIKNLFISKKLQRENLLNFDKKITVNFLKFKNIDEIDINKVLSEFSFPFIIKPSAGISSSGVIKINNKTDFENAIKNMNNTLKKIIKVSKIENYEIVIEEYIDGKMYTIDYFVDQEGKIYKSKIIRTYTLKDEYNIEDFGITKEVLGKEIEKQIDNEKLNHFIEKSVKACKIKNTFIHHEFKLTKSGELKTIELNGRIGGYRLEMYKRAYNLDLIEFLFNKNIKPNFITNYTFIGLFPKKETNKIFLGLKEEFIEKIQKLKSFYSYMIKKALIGKKIGFTKNGYKYFGTIRLVNKNFEEMQKDYNFIKENLDKNIIYKD